MNLSTVYTVTGARSQLPALIAATREGQMPLIGSHRKPEAVLMSAGVLDVYDLLLHGMARDEANLMLRGGSLMRGGVIHPGDPAGKVIAWLWNSGQRERLDEFVSTIITELRVWNTNAPTPRLRLADLLAGIPLALPAGFPQDEADQLIDFLREAVPRGFSENPDT